MLNVRQLLFDHGLIGCPDWHEFTLEEHAAGPAIQIMRSPVDAGISFFVTDPFTIMPDYAFEISDADAEALALHDPSDVLVLVILTILNEAPTVTANMLGPLVVNIRTGRGQQLVLANSDYSVRHSVTF